METMTNTAPTQHPRRWPLWVLASGLVVVAMAVIVVRSGAAGVVVEWLQRRTIASAHGPRAQQVEFIETDSPMFFGPSDVRLILRVDGEQRARIDTTISNDGKQLDDANWDVTWLDDGVQVRLLGEEQPPELCVLHLDATATCGVE